MISIDLKHEGELHKKIVEALRQRHRAAAKEHGDRVAKWKKAEEKLVGYVPEDELDAKRREKRDNGVPSYTTIQLPYTYAVVMAAHAYWSTVFLARNPVYQFQGLNDEGEMQVQALEALMNYQMLRGRMLPNHFIWLQDVGKYGEGWVSPYWAINRSRTARIVEQEQLFLGMVPTGRKKKVKETIEVVRYAGNQLYNLSPSDVFTDPRYSRGRFQEGEFIGLRTQVSINQLLEGRAEGRYINVERVDKKERRTYYGSHGETESTDAHGATMERPQVASITTDHDGTVSDVLTCYEYYVRLVPKRWGLGAADLPEIWVFTVTQDFGVVLECRPMENFHGRFPLAYLEVEPEGYAKFSRGLVDVFGSVQDTLDWLVNSHFFNVRQVLNNQWVLDPSRVETRDLENGTAGKAIRLKPAAYGSDVRTALQQLDVRDVTQSHLGDMSMMFQFGSRMGISDQIMGVDAPSSRRSAQEIRGAQTFSVSRLKTIAEYFSATGFSDLSDMMIQNSQQFYEAEMKLSIVGDLAQWAGQNFIDVTPEAIAGGFAYAPVDGTLPVDRFAQANLWREMMGQMAQVPQVGMQYDLGRIFAYTAQLMGLRNVNRFRFQAVPDETLLQQAASGQSVPLEQPAANPLEPGQVPLMGPTA